jgi:MGT family glycosyltransferase
VRIAITSIPYAGHLAPLLGVTAELVRRGHEVTFVTTAERAGQLRELGADVLEYRSPMQGEGPQADRDEDLSTVLPRLLREAAAVLPALERGLGARLPDCVINDVVSWGGTVFGHKHGILDVQAWPVFASNEVFSLERRYGQSLGDTALLQRFYDDLHAFAAAAGTPGAAEYLFAAADRNLVFMPRAFQYAGDTFDERYVFVGPCPTSTEVPPAATGHPLVLLSMGTAHDRGADFFRGCALALAGLPVRVLLVTGGCVGLSELRDLPANVTVRERVAQFSMLARTAVFVTHGGMNSVMAALYHAVPTVLLPDRVEQVANADRVAELGLGVRIAGVDQLRDAVRRVLPDEHIRVRLGRMSAAVRSAGGAGAAAGAVEEWAGARPGGGPATAGPPQRLATKEG